MSRTAVLSLICALTGCGSGGTGSIEGKVLVNGQPAKGVQVSFRQIDGAGDGLGLSDDNGHYVMFFGRGKRDFPAGEYKVAISGSVAEGAERSKVKLPKEITTLEQTPLRKTVQTGPNVIDLEVTSD